jgi:Pentapeptide repeats (8 copies)
MPGDAGRAAERGLRAEGTSDCQEDGLSEVKLQLPTTMKESVSPIWNSVVLQFERGRQSLMLRPQAAFFSAGILVALLLLIFNGVAAAVAAVAAWIALMRHFAQTDADRQRRITESYSKSVEQLAHDKIEVRLGGIYTLERISRESSNDYWTIMETLTAFVRERARWKKPDAVAPELLARDMPPELPTDIAAVLAVLVRRPEVERARERWRFDLQGADLRRANLVSVHLEGALLRGVHLEGANLVRARLQGAILVGAHLEGANLLVAHLEGASLTSAHLEGASLGSAHLERAIFLGAHFKGAHLGGAHLEGANLVGAHLEGVHLAVATGDAKTRLSDGVPRPAHWPPYQATKESGSDSEA